MCAVSECYALRSGCVVAYKVAYKHNCCEASSCQAKVLNKSDVVAKSSMLRAHTHIHGSMCCITECICSYVSYTFCDSV
jgi:hypothetical protein